MLKKSFGVLSASFGVLGDIYVILLLALFFFMSPKPYQQGILSLVPRRGRARAKEVWSELHTSLERWLKGKLISMLLVAVLTALGLWALGMPLVLALSIIAGILCFIPNFGPLLSAIPAVLVGFTVGPEMAGYVILLYVAVQFVESNLITPFIQREMVNLPLAMVMSMQVLLGLLTGTLGLILATPLLVISMVLVRMLYVQDVLGGGHDEE